jgi:hypothetical protein
MRERRWESRFIFNFDRVLSVCERLAGLGLKTTLPERDGIAYIEEWTVASPREIGRLDSWTMEDVTLVRIHENWTGDFYLLASRYRGAYEKHQASDTYCSASHPWRFPSPLQKHHRSGMLWVGFRDRTHSFIRVRLDTAEVITPGETRGDDARDLWLDERRRLFGHAVELMDLPIQVGIKNRHVHLRAEESSLPLFLSWPDAFGPCQFEYNANDPVPLLVSAGRLGQTFGPEPAAVRIYLTGFPEAALREFGVVETAARTAYRISIHCRLTDIPSVLSVIRPDGRLYATLCEFQTTKFLPAADPAWAIVGAVGTEEGFRIETRLNRAPLPEDRMAEWLEAVLGLPVRPAPLPPFP